MNIRTASEDTKDYDRVGSDGPLQWANRFDIGHWHFLVAYVDESSALVVAAGSWATSRGAAELKVETQNINVSACRFYESQGFELRHVNPWIYESLPNEVQLLWYKPVN